ncbi:MAG TPA: transcription elongation factor GreA [Spirochaetia bacterium]|nr:MAG: hypothetical protein A2Y30_02940 [Spirochaetes bacterium GWE1_32_154]OHD47613.1 MAG: hypothetical protein A2Y29_00385 [Spirochaetes bacterium GWE2_31_10]HBI37369.1 transcription elongation factor GreA [Spirochaetia bacterium]
MSSQLIEKYENLLNEEKWTRATINNYTVKNFEELNDLITQFYDNHIQSEILLLTEEYLNKNKNSIVALYVSTVFQITDGIIENNNVYSLIKIFSDNMKWNIVEYICCKITEQLKDKVVIRSLIEALNNLNKKESIYQYWEELIKVDYDEATIVVKLGEKKEAEGNIKEAISYYKKAINRNIHIKNFSQLEDIWKKLLTFEDVGCDFFINHEKRITRVFSIDKTVELFFLTYKVFKDKEDWETCIKILKLILDNDSRNEEARTEIVFVYKNKYAGHSYLDEYIKKSNLDGLWRTSNEAISTFEKHIAFDKGNFVFHRDWGLGVIKDIAKDDFIIDFQKSKNHKMSLKLAISSLQVLPKNHIWILKLKNLDKLREMVKNDPVWALKILIKSYNNKAKMKDFKIELVPDVLKTSEWNSWWTNAKKLMKEDTTFGTVDDNNDTYELRDKPISVEERTSNMFKASKDFMQRFNIAYQYFNETDDPDSDLLDSMANYFTTYLKTTDNVNEQTFMSYLLLKQFQKKYNFMNIQFTNDFKILLKGIEDPLEIYEKITLGDLKKDFLLNLKNSNDSWQETYIRFFHIYPSEYIFKELLLNSKQGDKDYIEKLVKDLIATYKENREAFFWIVSKELNEDLAKKMDIIYDNIILSLLHLIEITGKDVSIKKEMTKNKKLGSQVKDYLFKNNYLEKYIEKSDENFCKRLYNISNELISLDGNLKIKIRTKISERFPEIDVDNQSLTYSEGKKSSIMDKLLTTKESYYRMQRELHNISEVQIPENSKDIGEAMERGDLKENSEFKAAKEKQEILRNKLTKLHNDLTKAIIVDRKEIKSDFVTFGTKVSLIDKLDNNNPITYTILGPWESDTEKNIISYQSPLGSKMLDKKVKEDVSFTLNDKEYHYVIKKIEVTDF